MVKTCDVGSLPFVGDHKKFLKGALSYGLFVDDSTAFFERRIIESYLDKVHVGIDVPNYPQYRDMNQMFLDMLEGIDKVDGNYIETGGLTIKKGQGVIPEVLAIKNCSKEIGGKLDKTFKLRVSITGPYTFSMFFAYKDKSTFSRLGNVLTQTVEHNFFNNKFGRVTLVTLDEPAFGFIDDPLLDKGSEARENLIHAWESILQKARSTGAQTCFHLHSTKDELFWEVKSLNTIEPPVNDIFYQTKRTKEKLESTDKFLNATIGITDFDQLIRAYIMAKVKEKPSEVVINENIAETWKKLGNKTIDPTIFIENVELMKERLTKVIERFDINRVLYAGPECGLASFPTYESALECLRRVSNATSNAAL
jgi:5-methyltetrahydropteroyltriglutamate--homocysteine methyltransferase